MKQGFSLAEVLITLGIIAIVAAMTLPQLIKNYKDQIIINKAKKDYSQIMQALQLAQGHYGTPNDNSSLFLDGSTSEELAENFSKYFQSAFLCKDSSKSKQCTKLHYKVLRTAYENSYEYLNLPAILLPDESVIYISLSSNKCTPTENSGVLLDSKGQVQKDEDGNPKMWHSIRDDCGMIKFDVNGPKLPNVFGHDVFAIQVWSNHIGKPYWDVYGTTSLFSILSGGELKYNYKR